MKYISKYFAPFGLILLLSTLALAQAKVDSSLIIVVQGIGGGDPQDGWARRPGGRQQDNLDQPSREEVINQVAAKPGSRTMR